MFSKFSPYMNMQLLYFISFSVVMVDFLFHLLWLGYRPIILIVPALIAISAMAITSFASWQNIAKKYELLASQSFWRLILNLLLLCVFALIFWALYFFHIGLAPKPNGLVLFLAPMYVIYIPATIVFILMSVFYRPYRFATKN